MKFLQTQDLLIIPVKGWEGIPDGKLDAIDCGVENMRVVFLDMSTLENLYYDRLVCGKFLADVKIRESIEEIRSRI